MEQEIQSAPGVGYCLKYCKLLTALGYVERQKDGGRYFFRQRLDIRFGALPGVRPGKRVLLTAGGWKTAGTALPLLMEFPARANARSRQGPSLTAAPRTDPYVKDSLMRLLR